MRGRSRLILALTSSVTFGAIAVAACTTASSRAPLDARDDDASGTKKRDGSTVPTGPDVVKPEVDPPLPDGGKPPGRVYAHTADTLYLFDPLAKSLKAIGPLSCLTKADEDAGVAFDDRLLDIALDRDGVMYGTTDLGFVKIDAVDASCIYVRDDALVKYPNSLAFVPIGTVDPTKEVLVGYQYDPAVFNQATVYVRIDLATGVVAKIGDLNPPGAAVKYRSSGDLIALIRNGNKAYVTVKRIGDDAGTVTDFLAEVDPKTGAIKAIVGDTKKVNLFGFGQWAGTGYGFSSTGEILEIDMSTGAAKAVTGLSGDAGVVPSWFGAGVTTDSPTKP